MATRRQLSRPRPSWAWQDDAACRGEDLALFFGTEGERPPARDVRERKAKAICGQCPVRNECLDFALTRPEKDGLWGGLSEDERASERRRRMRRAADAGARRAITAVEPAPDDGPDEKTCPSCKETRSAADFPRDITSADGLFYACKPCKRQPRAEVA